MLLGKKAFGFIGSVIVDVEHTLKEAEMVSI